MRVLLLCLLCGCGATPTLLRARWADGAAEYGIGARVQWARAQLPLRYFVVPDGLEGDEDMQAVHRAAEWWNEQLHAPVFVRVRDVAQATVRVCWGGVHAAAAAAAVTRHFGTDGPTAAEVRLQAVPDGLTLETIAVHEFGHVLGLAHSHDYDDVMRPRLTIGSSQSATPEELLALWTMYIERH